MSHKCPLCGSGVVEDYVIKTIGRRPYIDGTKHIRCFSEECGAVSSHYTDTDAAFASLERGELPMKRGATP